MGNRRRLAPSSDGKSWSTIAVAAGTLLAGLAAALGVVLSQLGSSATPAPPGPVAGAGAGVSPVPEAPPSIGSSSPGASVVQSIAMLPEAVARIESTGAFADPLDGSVAAALHGSGFVVDSTGIVVTNSHLVTGAETVSVWVGPQRSAYVGKVLGISECSDLAVVELDARQPLMHLDWHEGQIALGDQVYSAGFQLDDTLPTVKRGVVSRSQAAIDAWASVDDAIGHDANILTGFSGGPVVTNDGRAVGVNYAWDAQANETLAIGRSGVEPILSDLRSDQSVASIGINGYALEVYDSEPNPTAPAGIWVTSVKPDSAAARAGILPGDVVTELDGKRMGVRGTMAEYCEVLRTHPKKDPFPFTVYRAESRDYLRGDLNDSPVKGFSFAVMVGGAPSVPPPATEDEPVYTEDRTLYVEAPSAWPKHRDYDWEVGGKVVGPGLIISSDLRTFEFGFQTPGALIRVNPTYGDTAPLDTVLDASHSRFESLCDVVGRAQFTRGGYTGVYDHWKACDDATSQFFTIAAKNSDGSHIVYIQFQAADLADLATLDRMLTTLEYDPDGV